ncbi:MAG: hypothetical protein WB563_17890, partial [Pseudolabrys sp.]
TGYKSSRTGPVEDSVVRKIQQARSAIALTNRLTVDYLSACGGNVVGSRKRQRLDQCKICARLHDKMDRAR